MIKLKLIRDKDPKYLDLIDSNTGESIDGVERVELTADYNGLKVIIHMCADSVAVDVPEYDKLVAVKASCVDCSGSGKYIGVNYCGPCKACGGTGYV